MAFNDVLESGEVERWPWQVGWWWGAAERLVVRWRRGRRRWWAGWPWVLVMPRELTSQEQHLQWTTRTSSGQISKTQQNSKKTQTDSKMKMKKNKDRSVVDPSSDTNWYGVKDPMMLDLDDGRRNETKQERSPRWPALSWSAKQWNTGDLLGRWTPTTPKEANETLIEDNNWRRTRLDKLKWRSAKTNTISPKNSDENEGRKTRKWRTNRDR